MIISVIRQWAGTALVITVLVLAAIVGLIVGSALDGRFGAAGTPGAANAPAAVDAASAPDPNASLTRPHPR